MRGTGDGARPGSTRRAPTSTSSVSRWTDASHSSATPSSMEHGSSSGRSRGGRHAGGDALAVAAAGGRRGDVGRRLERSTTGDYPDGRGYKRAGPRRAPSIVASDGGRSPCRRGATVPRRAWPGARCPPRCPEHRPRRGRGGTGRRSATGSRTHPQADRQWLAAVEVAADPDVLDAGDLAQVVDVVGDLLERAAATGSPRATLAARLLVAPCLGRLSSPVVRRTSSDTNEQEHRHHDAAVGRHPPQDLVRDVPGGRTAIAPSAEDDRRLGRRRGPLPSSTAPRG